MLSWAIAGTSFISDTMASAIAHSDSSQIKAVFGRDPGRLSNFADRHAIERRYTDFDEMLADREIDVVYIGLPNHLHAQAVIKAAAKGKAILSEKSLTTTMKDAMALAQAVRSTEVFFMEGLMYLCHPFMDKLGEIVRSGRLGTIRSITGFYAANIWHLVNPQGSGTIFNLGCYPVSLLHYIMQEAFGRKAFQCRTISGIGNLSVHDGNICDATLAIRFSNGVVATVQSTDSYGMSFDFSIHGDRGALHFKTNPWLPVAGENIMEVVPYGGEAEAVTVNSSRDAYQHQVLRVEECVRGGSKEAVRPCASLSDSLDIVELLTAWEKQCKKVL